MPQLDPTWFASQLFWLFITFSVLYMLLSQLILPPLQKIITSRQGVIDNDLAVAQDLKLQAEQARQSYEETLAKSRLTAQSLISDAALDAKKRAEEATKALDAQIATQSANAGAAIAAKKQEFMSELLPATADFSAMIVEKLTSRAPSGEQVKRALEQNK